MSIPRISARATHACRKATLLAVLLLVALATCPLSAPAVEESDTDDQFDFFPKADPDAEVLPSEEGSEQPSQALPARTPESAERDNVGPLADAERTLAAIATERGDKKRIERLKDFLKRNREPRQRHMAYRLWLYSGWRAMAGADVKAAADAYLAEYPLSPESYGAVSRYLLEADLERNRGYEAGKEALRLYELELDTDGSLESLRSLLARSGDPSDGPVDPAADRRRFLEYFGARFNLARYELLSGQRNAALRLVEPVIALDPFTTEDEDTLAPFYLAAGEAYDSLAEYPRAYRHYLGALIAGDSTNRFARVAEARMNKIAEKLTDSQAEDAVESYLPKALYSVAWPNFKDVTKKYKLAGVSADSIAWADVDSDTYPDLLTDGSVMRLNGKGHEFRSPAKTTGLPGAPGRACFADGDNDGDLDLLTIETGSGDLRFFSNDGKGQFKDISALAGDLSSMDRVASAAWIDDNRDGRLDVALLRFGASTGGGAHTLGIYRGVAGMQYSAASGQVLATSLGGTAVAAYGLSVIDPDGTGLPDLVTGFGHGGVSLWLNRAADGYAASNVAFAMPRVTGGSVSGGIDWGDIDNDSDLDLAYALGAPGGSEPSGGSGLILAGANESGGQYSDIRRQAGLRLISGGARPCFADFNNDGNQDLYFACPGAGRRSFLYLNDGQGGWHDVTYLSHARVLDAKDCAVADIDRDGDLDLAVLTASGIRLLSNETAPQSWIQVVVKGGKGPRSGKPAAAGPQQPATAGLPYSNASGLGARIVLTSGGREIVRDLHSSTGGRTGSELVAHFGLGQQAGRLAIKVIFPSGRVVTRAIMDSGKRIEIDEYDPQTVPQTGTGAVIRPQ